MKKFSFAALVQFVLLPALLIVPAIGSSGAESTTSATQHQHLHSATVASPEDMTSANDATISDAPRVLKKAKGNAKKPKAPKGGKVSKSSKASSGTPCDSITTQKDALFGSQQGRVH